MPVFQGRIEAKHVVPTGGASVSVSTGAMSSAVTATLPAGNYFLSAAGGVSSSTTALQTALNENAQGYPQSASAMQSAVGYGVWSSGWLFNIASGNDTGAFGGVTMTAAGTPLYSIAGPRAGIDLAVGVDAAADQFTGGNNFNVTATDDLVIAWVGKFTAAPAADEMILVKGNGGAARWTLYRNSAGTLIFDLTSASGTKTSFVGAQTTVGSWHAGMAVLDRAGNIGNVALCVLGSTPLVGTASTTFAETMLNADNLTVLNRAAGLPATNFQIAALYIGTGTSAAASMGANINTAVQRFANAVNSSFAVTPSLTGTSATGRVAISNSFYPCSVSWTSTDLRDLLGFDRNVDYPATAAQMATAVGYGTFTSGAAWLCNESSGNLSPVFGAVTLTPGNTPTYTNAGARGGSDKSIGYSATNSYFTGGDVFDVTASDDLIALWVGRFSGSSAATALISKGSGVPGWYVSANASGPYLEIYDPGGSATSVVSPYTAEFHIGIACIDRSTGKMRIGTYGLTSSASSVAAEVTAVTGSLANASALNLGASFAGGTANTGLTMSYVAVVAGPGVATGLSANLSTALSNFATYMKSQTSQKQAKGLFFPDSPLQLEGDPDQAPRVTDHRTSMSPTGNILGLVGNSMYRHRGVQWTHVPKDRTWESAATYANASWETFCKDAIFGLGHAWMTPSSQLQIYYDRAGTQVAVGNTYNSSVGVPGWSVVNLSSIEPKKSVGDWTGLFRIELGDIVSAG